VESYRELRDYKEAITIVKQLMEKEPENEQLKKYLRNLQEKRLLENLVEPYDYYTY
jgi:antitoxin component HigA of HigAB toxin-antitoxin module